MLDLMFFDDKELNFFLNLITIARMTFCFHYYSSSDNFIFFLILLFILLFRSKWFIFTVQSICSKKRNVVYKSIKQKILEINNISLIIISFHHRRTVGSSNIHVAMYLIHLLVCVLYLKQQKQDHDYI